MYLRLPRTLPHPLAGRCVRILHARYGLRESNRLFNLEMTRVLVPAVFLPRPSEPQLFVCLSSDSVLRRYACAKMDDALVLTISAFMRDRLFTALGARFGHLTVN